MNKPEWNDKHPIFHKIAQPIYIVKENSVINTECRSSQALSNHEIGKDTPSERHNTPSERHNNPSERHNTIEDTPPLNIDKIIGSLHDDLSRVEHKAKKF